VASSLDIKNNHSRQAIETASAAHLEQQLANHNDWRRRMIRIVANYEQWLRNNERLNDDNRQTLQQTTRSLNNDRITIALVGEYSRGKTELINAIFFADYKRRLLPSTPGRTTMCTTEILFNEDEQPSLRLLPIETRRTNQLMSELSNDDSHWQIIPLNVDCVAEMTETLKEISKTRLVTQDAAKELGFRINRETIDSDTGEVQIPLWRHAVVNYPHPLLKQGLVVLDTPGLNALGSEPELTLSMLPNAHAVVFVLAADTGVTHTDLQIWKNHVHVPSGGDKRGRLATLNKIDTLWDELLSEQEISDNIRRQINETSRLLEVPTDNVIAISAAKGLVAKVKSDDLLLKRAGLTELENKLSFDIIGAKNEILRDRVADQIGTMIDTDRNVVASRLEQREKEFSELKTMHGKGHDVLQDSIAKLLEQKHVFEIEVESFRATRRMLTQQIQLLADMLSVDRYDRICEDTQKNMLKSLTTSGIKNDISSLFAEMTETLKRVEAQSEKVRGLITHSYNKFHHEHGLPKMVPMKFAMDRYTGKLAELINEAMSYRDSTSVLVKSRNAIISHFFNSIIVRIRTLIGECDAAAQHWALSVLNPIHDQLHEHRHIISQRIENLTALRDSQLDLENRLESISQDTGKIKDQLVEIQNLADAVNQNRPADRNTDTVEPIPESARQTTRKTVATDSNLKLHPLAAGE